MTARRGRGAGGETPPDPAAAEELRNDPESVARTICLRLLTQRARSRHELSEALARRGVPDDAAGRVLDRFTEVGLIDDTAMARAMASSQHQERGLARRAVAVGLRRKGFDDDTVSDALSGIGAEGERERAEQLVARRVRALRTLPPDVQARRLVGLLARKGYSSGVAWSVVREAVGREQVPDDADG